jgi:hypothetical protein
MISEKYPRTYHLPFSEGVTRDDRVMPDVDELLDIPIVFSEKMDGSNVSLERKEVFARSHGKAPAHKSFSLLKAMHSGIKHQIPEKMQVFCEYLYARHTVPYYNLPNYLMVIGVREVTDNVWLSIIESQNIASKLGLSYVPILGDASTSFVSSERELKDVVYKLMRQASCYSKYREGIVVRASEEFYDRDFPWFVGKFVSKKFKPNKTKHWKYSKIEKNGLYKDNHE